MRAQQTLELAITLILNPIRYVLRALGKVTLATFASEITHTRTRPPLWQRQP